MNKESSNYPENWCEVYLAEIITSLESGRRPKGGVSEYLEGTPSLGGEHLDDNGGFKFRKIKYVPISFSASMSKGHIEHEDILIVKDGATTGKVSFVDKSFPYNIAVINEHLFSVKLPTALNKRWIFYQLWSQGGNEQILLDFKGAAQGGISSRFAELVKVFIPPLAEQERIVAKIEELFSELDKSIENLKAAREQLKVYRQALLKHAFEGKLTADWRKENNDKLETASALQQRIQTERAARYQQLLAEWETKGKQGSKPKAPKQLPPMSSEEVAYLPELPEGWSWTRMIESCEQLVDCHNKTAPYQKAGIPLIRTPSIRDMKLNFDDSIRYVSEETYKFWSKRCPPLPGDILFTREAPMGEAAIIPDGKTVCMGQRMMLLRPSKFLSAKYLLSATQTPTFKKISKELAVGTGVQHLRVGDVERLTFPICSYEEQIELVLKLDSSLSEIDHLDQTITTALQQSDALRQSILKKAFSGTLVAQDANDEPASVLLARIKAEKAAQVVTTKPRKTKKVHDIPEPAKTNVILFPIKIPNISTTDLHAGLMAMAYQHHEQKRKAWYFGHVKAEKIAHMIEAHLGVDLERYPIKDAAGPNDFQRLLATEAAARANNWFDVQKLPNGRHMLYKMQGFDGLIKNTINALGEQVENVNALIALFVPLDKTRSEIVATLYAAWNNLLILGHKPSDEEIVIEATENWHADKLKIRRERFFKCLTWMRGHGLAPTGKGRYVKNKE